MNVASLVRLCLPEPPTPTSNVLPTGVRITRDIYKHANSSKRVHSVLHIVVITASSTDHTRNLNMEIVVREFIAVCYTLWSLQLPVRITRDI